jgi:aspartyl-tRNA(Asn)/glutamyl-tRNA(Gln) amidotransferase subunit B
VEYIDNSFEAVIGLEVHTQLLTKTKMFCSCPNLFGQKANSLVCPVCLALPGSLPVINFNAIKLAVKAALALNLNINKKSLFARKNYFYPDLPKGYQISQYHDPISSKGFLDIELQSTSCSGDNILPAVSNFGSGDIPPAVSNGHSRTKRIRINRLHLEEDAGKLLHIGDKSYVDLNRAGTPLAEIVSEPDLSSPLEAVSYLKALRDILVYLEISDGNMEEGSFRCDANISVRKRGDDKLGTRTEIKNVNSFKFIEKALEYEINRQIELILNGKGVIQQTLLFNSKTGKTEPMRSKEEAHDYRYFEEPDLPPLILSDEFVENIKNSFSEADLPSVKRKRYIKEYSLTLLDAEVLTQDRRVAYFFEECIEINKSKGFNINKKHIANWIVNDLLFYFGNSAFVLKFLGIVSKPPFVDILKNHSMVISLPLDLMPGTQNIEEWIEAAGILAYSYLPDIFEVDNRENEKKIIAEKIISPENFLKLISEVEKGNVNKNTGKEILRDMLLPDPGKEILKGMSLPYKTAEEIIKKNNLVQVSDEKLIEGLIKGVFEENPKELNDLISGKDKLFGFFVGEAMKKTKGKANPKKVNEILQKYIENYKSGRN